MRLIHRLTGTEMLVPPERAEEYLRAGHRPAPGQNAATPKTPTAPQASAVAAKEKQAEKQAAAAPKTPAEKAAGSAAGPKPAAAPAAEKRPKRAGPKKEAEP